MMERFASAYGRALFPRRYGSKGGSPAQDGAVQPAALATGELELAISAGIYRAVLGAERLLESLRQRAARRGERVAAGRQNTPIGCG